jgi:hypothetical protein
VRRGDPHAPRDFGLAASLRFAELSEDPTIHNFARLRVSCHLVNGRLNHCQIGNSCFIVRSLVPYTPDQPVATGAHELAARYRPCAFRH